MTEILSNASRDQLFGEARTFSKFTPEEVSEALLRMVYDLAKFGPTAINAGPARFVFLTSSEAKERLKPHLDQGNVAKTMAAPVTVIIAYDMDFPEHLPVLFPHAPQLKDAFPDMTARETFCLRNGSLQGAYLMLAARTLGLSCGPMSGFNNAGVDAEFFAGQDGMDSWRSNFLCNIGYGDPDGLRPRGPRLAFETACRVL